MSREPDDVKPPFLIILEFLDILKCVGGGFLTNWFSVCLFFFLSLNPHACQLLIRFTIPVNHNAVFRPALIHLRAASK